MRSLKKISKKLQNVIAIDLGTANIRVMIQGDEKVIMEPCIVAINESTGKILAVGEEARKMIGRTPSNIRAIQPLKNGVISDFKATESIIYTYINRSLNNRFRLLSRLSWLRVIVAVPSLITEVEIKAVIDSAKSAGAKKIYIVEEPIASAIGSSIKIEDSVGNMIVDIGGGTTDIAIISMGGIVVDNTIKVAGDSMDFSIQEYVRSKYNILIGIKMAEDLKMAIGTAISSGNLKKMEVKGQDLLSGLPRVIEISSLEISEAISPILNKILVTIKEAIEKSPPEIASDLLANGITLTGGGALIKDIDKYFSKNLGISIHIPDDPIMSVSRGLRMMLDDNELLSRVNFKDFIFR